MTKLNKIEGLDESMEEKLKSAGFTNAEHLVAASATKEIRSDLAKIIDIRGGIFTVFIAKKEWPSVKGHSFFVIFQFNRVITWPCFILLWFSLTPHQKRHNLP